jgi:hypothetical protein
MPAKQREELLQLLGRMLSEQIERVTAAKEVRDEPR